MAKGGQGLLQVRVALLERVGSGLGLSLPGEHSLQVAGSHSGRWVVLRSCCQTTSQARPDRAELFKEGERAEAAYVIGRS